METILYIPFYSEISNYQEYFLLKDNFIYKIIIEKNKDNIIIKNNKYIQSFNLNDLKILVSKSIKSIDKAYEFIIKSFEENRVSIKNIILNKEIKLIIKIDNEKEIEMRLIYNKQNKENNDFMFNEMKKLK